MGRGGTDLVPSPRGAGRGLGRGARVAAAFLLITAVTGCEEVSHHDIADEINILVKIRRPELVGPATERLARYRRSAIPQIETAMHTSAPPGRLHLITTLEKIGDGEAVPVLRHVAVFDITPEVRDAAEHVLSRWAGGGGPRATRARAALDEIARKRAAGVGPLQFGDNGIPGVPSTVGAPEPIGSDDKP
jgi:hypothetical protein